MRRLIPLAITLVAGYGLLCLVAFLGQKRLVYFPGGDPDMTPGELGLAFEEVELVAADGVRLHGWFLPAPEAGEPGARRAIHFSHGNAGNIGHRLEGARAFVRMGCAVLLYDYRGYGKSGGSPDEEGTYLDAQAGYAFLRGRGFGPAEIVAYGESLGGAVAIELARREEVGRLVVESSFTSIPDLATGLYPWLPVRLLCRIEYESIAKIAQVGVPVLVIHSPEDELVPVDHGRALFAAAAEPKGFLETDGGHNGGGFLRERAWRDRLAGFLWDGAPSRPGGAPDPSRPGGGQ